MTILDTYYFPRMDECIETVGDAIALFPFGSNRGCFYIPIYDIYKGKITFTIHFGLYCFNFMLFGLMNFPPTLYSTLDVISNHYNWKSCLVYLYYFIILFSRDPVTYLKDEENVLRHSLVPVSH